MLSVLLAIGAAPAFAQEGRYTTTVDVSRILIDARVVDPKGQPIRDLQPGDFEVKIAGKAARVESVQWVGAQPAEGGAIPPLDSQMLGGIAQPAGRLVVFLFQKSLEERRVPGMMRILHETHRILEKLTPEDRVAVLSFDSHLSIWLDFTNDYARAREVIEHDVLMSKPPEDVESSRGVTIVGGALTQAKAARVYTMEKSLRLVGESLANVPGTKSLVLAGYGMGRFTGDSVYMESGYGEAVRALRSARVTVLTLDTTDADYHSLQAGLQMVAGHTGGLYGSLYLFPMQAIDRVIGALAGHYVLFVEPPEQMARGTHEVVVRLLNRSGEIVAKPMVADVR